MKTKKLRFLGMTLLMGLFSWQSVSAATGWFNDYVSLNTNGNVAQYTMSTAGGTDLNGIDLGSVGTLKITACDLKYWEDVAPGRTGGSLWYKIMAADNTTEVVPAVETVWTQSYIGGADYQGILSNLNINLLTGLTVGTTYKLHVWAKSTGINGDDFLSNGGSDYVVTFTYKPVTIYGANGIADATGYATLSAAFTAINGQGTQAGKSIIVKINGSTSETAQAVLNQPSVSTWDWLQVYPTSSNLSVSGSFASALISLNGADKVSINGAVNGVGSIKDLQIHHTQAKGAVVFTADASNNCIRNCTVKGAPVSATSAVIYSVQATPSGNDNDSIINNNITGGSGGRPYFGILSTGVGAGNENDGMVISDNNIYDIINNAAANPTFISIGTRTPGVTITGNSMYETGSISLTPTATKVVYGIAIGTTSGTPNGHTITGNYFGGTAPQCGGGTMIITATSASFGCNLIPIYVNTLSTTATSIQGNTIKAISYSGPAFGGNLWPITIGSNSNGTFNVGTVTGNTIGATTGTGSISFTSNKTAGGDNFTGIYYAPVGASTSYFDCENNTIGSITVNGPATVPTHFFGIRKTIALYSSTIANNLIGSNTTANSIDVTSQCTATATQTVYGIFATGKDATFTGNVIRNLTNRNNFSTTLATAAVTHGINSTATGVVNISNNTISDLTAYYSQKGTASAVAIAGIYSTGTASPTTNAMTIDGNTIFNLQAAYTDYAGYMSGIHYAPNNTATTNSVSKNFIYGMSAPNLSTGSAIGTGARMFGIELFGTGASNSMTAANNIVSLSSDVDNVFFGIVDYANVATATSKLYHNTVYIGGTVGGTALLTSTALQSGSNVGIRDYRNNILMNNRTLASPATGLSYAIFYAAAGNSNLTADFNDYWVPNVGTLRNYVAKYFNSTTITAVGPSGTVGTLSNVNGKDANSLFTDPSFKVSGSIYATDYYTYGNISLIGDNTITDVPTDYLGTNRTSFRMGAFEDGWLGTINNEVQSANLGLMVTSKGVFVPLEETSMIELYSINGILIEKTIADGSYSRNINNGMYIIRVNGKAMKFIK